MTYWKYLTPAALLALAIWACGPDFGLSLLTTRKESLLAPPAFSFYRQLETLVPRPKDGLKARTEDQAGWPANLTATEAGTPHGVTIENLQKLEDGQAAYALGKDLPPVLRHYTAAAVAFKARQYGLVKEQLNALLALPPAERRPREVAAHYLLTQLACQDGDALAVRTHAASTRDAAQSGAPDPHGLAIRTIGDEALTYWQLDEPRRAVDLYAQQAAYGDESGRASLIMVARRIIANPKLLDQGIQDPLTRQLLITCLTARNDSDWKLERFLAALEKHHIRATPGAGLLAAASYSRGNFPLAQRFAAQEQGGAAAWVRGKLALRRGDQTAALAEYSRALQTARETNADSLNPNTLAAENSALRLNAGEYTTALDLMMEATQGYYSDYWTDAAYLAERVLTTKELRQYVDRKMPLPVAMVKGEFDSEYAPAPRRLRAVLARRLMREALYADALPYFDDPKIRDAARAYPAALARAQSGWRPNKWKAEAWMEAARLARHQGIDILGYELAPDYAVYGGNFEWPSEEDLRKSPATAAERERLEASAAPRNVRFHYRLTAVDHAMKAADLVPARSGGFAAILCEAGRWVVERHPPTYKRVHSRYIREGAWVPWASRFGQACPVPNIESSAAWQARMALRRASRRAGFDVIPLAALTLSALALVALTRYLYRPNAR